jgi:RecB family exonuclease
MGLLTNTIPVPPPPPLVPDLPKFSYRYFERYDDKTLARIRKTIEVVLDDRTRQFSLFDDDRAPEPVPILDTSDAFDFATKGAAAPAPRRETELGDVLSPSQVRQFLDCQARWWFRYGAKLPDPRNGNLALGSAVHKVHELFYRRKLHHEQPMDMPTALEVFRAAWAQQLEGDVTFGKDEKVDELEASGCALVTKWLSEGNPDAITPAAIEQRVAGQIGGVDVQGYIDLRDVNGRIIDLKTAKAKPSGISPDYAFQLATYRQLDPAASGEARLTTLVRTKTPQHIVHDYTVTAEDQMMTQRIYPMVQDGIKEGIYLPNRGSNLCSRRNCNFWAACQKEYGGIVDE